MLALTALAFNESILGASYDVVVHIKQLVIATDGTGGPLDGNADPFVTISLGEATANDEFKYRVAKTITQDDVPKSNHADKIESTRLVFKNVDDQYGEFKLKFEVTDENAAVDNVLCSSAIITLQPDPNKGETFSDTSNGGDCTDADITIEVTYYPACTSEEHVTGDKVIMVARAATPSPPGGVVNCRINLDVDEQQLPVPMTITETIPRGFEPLDSNPPAALVTRVSTDGLILRSLKWDFPSAAFGDKSILYTLQAPQTNVLAIMAGIINVQGTNMSISGSPYVSIGTNPPLCMIGPLHSDSNEVGQGVSSSFAAWTVDPDGGGIVRYVWNFGDGASVITKNPVVEHTYRTLGNFAVGLIADDDEGQSGAASQIITVVRLESPRLVLQNTDGSVGTWFMQGANLAAASLFNPNNVGDVNWRIVGTGEFKPPQPATSARNANGDLVFQHSDGTLAVWYMNGINLISAALLKPNHPGDVNWRAVGTADFNRDAKTDLLFQHKDGSLAVWYMNGIELIAGQYLSPKHPGDVNWRAIGTGHFNADGKVDVLFQHADGTLAAWFLNGVDLVAGSLLKPNHPGDAQWRAVSTTDLNQDGRTDLLFQHSSDGSLAVWFMNGITLSQATLLTPSYPGDGWKIVAP